jgi:poly-gamma-glutamate synthesis protein (capsule biosynthesis protein)
VDQLSGRNRRSRRLLETTKPESKELEDPSQRYHFRTSPEALGFLAESGVDVVTMANNHGADYGPAGLIDTLHAIRDSPIPVVGIGVNRAAAFAAHRVLVDGTSLAFLAADGSFREGLSQVWAAGPTTPGIAAARSARPPALIAAVRRETVRNDVVVVYLHWGTELESCPSIKQRATAQALADAGADVIVGSHAHVLLGSGWLGETYVNYGLGNFLWYHDHEAETGVLQLQIRDGTVVGDRWTPARIRPNGRPLPLHGRARTDAVTGWQRLRSCTDLTARLPGRHERE